MSFIEGSSSTLTNSTTRVAIVAAPASGVRRLVRTITVYNADTAPAVVILEYSIPAGTTDRVIARENLGVGDYYIFNDLIVLGATNNTISVSLNAAVTTNQLQCTAHYADVSS